MEKFDLKYKIEKEFEKENIFNVIHKIESANYSFEICEWGSRAIASITYSAMQSGDSLYLADFLDCEACESVLKILKRFALSSTIISTCILAIISCLSFLSRDIREYFGTIEACELVLFTISMHYGDELISEYGASSVCYLAKENIHNSYKLAESGACEVMSQTGVFGFNIRNDKSKSISSYVSLAFACLSEAINVKRLKECGACELVTQLLKVHSESEHVVVSITKAICCLSSLNFDLREDLGKSNCCEYIVKTIKQYKSNMEIIKDGIESIMHLSLSPSNSNKLGCANACETIVECLERNDKVHIYDICFAAMLNLVTFGSDAGLNIKKLLDKGAVVQIKRAQMNALMSLRAREHTTQLLELLQISTSKQDDKISFVGVVFGSEAKEGINPLSIEIREYESFAGLLQNHNDNSYIENNYTDNSTTNSNSNSSIYSNNNNNTKDINSSKVYKNSNNSIYDDELEFADFDSDSPFQIVRNIFSSTNKSDSPSSIGNRNGNLEEIVNSSNRDRRRSTSVDSGIIEI